MIVKVHACVKCVRVFMHVCLLNGRANRMLLSGDSSKFELGRDECCVVKMGQHEKNEEQTGRNHHYLLLPVNRVTRACPRVTPALLYLATDDRHVLRATCYVLRNCNM